MKRYIIFVGIVILAISAIIVWKLHPWIKPGHSIKLGEWESKGFEFQVWQIKNESLLEPFATGLFFRQKSGVWRVVCLSPEDNYRPAVRIESDGSVIAIFHRGRRVMDIDAERATIFRVPDRVEITQVEIKGNPPSNWWIK